MKGGGYGQNRQLSVSFCNQPNLLFSSIDSPKDEHVDENSQQRLGHDRPASDRRKLMIMLT